MYGVFNWTLNSPPSSSGIGGQLIDDPDQLLVIGVHLGPAHAHFLGPAHERHRRPTFLGS